VTAVSLEGVLDGPTNMARDAALLCKGGGGRVYSWDGPWVSLGRHQTAERALRPACGVPWVGRPTGGKAVLHGHDVTVGLGLTWQALGVAPTRSVADAYRAVARPLVAALRACGVRAALGEETSFGRSAGAVQDCFAHVAPNDIVDDATGVKVCGCALRVDVDGVLVQASVPAGRPLVEPSLVFDRAAPVHWVSLDAATFADALQEALRREMAPPGATRT
jgi:lipoate-protein ligase A